jgi:CBS domain-containing protein
MKFFTAGDVLDQAVTADPTEPVTVGLGTTIQEALEIMFEHNFSLLPAIQNGRVEGVVSYLSVCRVLKAVDHPSISELTIKSAIEEPVFVPTEKDIYDLFETFAADHYVLVGEPDELKGVMTRYDIFYFLKNQVEPFLIIGEIEQNLQELFDSEYSDIDRQIQETFEERAKHDESYDIPDLQDFDLGDYQFFLGKNWKDLSEYFYDNHSYIDDLLDDVRDIRNSLFHFREEAHRIDRDKLQIAHRHITAAV